MSAKKKDSKKVAARKTTPRKKTQKSAKKTSRKTAKKASKKTAKKAAKKTAKKTSSRKSPRKTAKPATGTKARGSTASKKSPSKSAKPKAASGARPSKRTRRLPKDKIRRIREALALKRRMLTQHIQAELTELERPEKKHRADLEEIASDTHETDSLCEIMGIESTQIEQIEKAMAKIDGGTYGICEDCGGDIPVARLEALPFATQCIECKRKAELEGAFAEAPAFRF